MAGTLGMFVRGGCARADPDRYRGCTDAEFFDVAPTIARAGYRQTLG